MVDDRRQSYQGAPSCGRGGKRGLNTKLHLAVDAHGMPVRLLVTEGTAADCSQAGELIEGIDAVYLLADKAYDADAILCHCQEHEVEPVIPAKRNRREPRAHDTHLYRHRHLVENAFLWLKRWRGIATRYAKNMASFLAAAQIRCLALWVNIL